MKMYICNKAKKRDICITCEHSEPHELVEYRGEKCNSMTDCYNFNDVTIKVKCIPVKQNK